MKCRSYTHLNLRFNPFGRLTPQEESCAALPALNTAALLAHLQHPRSAVQFLGPSGRGKSSHLMALRAHFPDAPYLYIARGQPVPPMPRTPVVFVDEMQRVPRPLRRDLFARGAVYVIASHVDHSRELARVGIDYHLVRLGAVDAPHLQAILNRRIAIARRCAHLPLPTITQQLAQRLIARCGADQWAMNSILYDLFETLATPDDLAASLTIFLQSYRLPWRRRLLAIETPRLAPLIDLLVH